MFCLCNSLTNKSRFSILCSHSWLKPLMRKNFFIKTVRKRVLFVYFCLTFENMNMKWVRKCIVRVSGKFLVGQGFNTFQGISASFTWIRNNFLQPSILGFTDTRVFVRLIYNDRFILGPSIPLYDFKNVVRKAIQNHLANLWLNFSSWLLEEHMSGVLFSTFIWFLSSCMVGLKKADCPFSDQTLRNTEFVTIGK